MEENTNIAASNAITQSDVDSYAPRRYAHRALRVVLATLLAFLFFAPIATIPLVKFKKKFVVFPILFVVTLVAAVIGFILLGWSQSRSYDADEFELFKSEYEMLVATTRNTEYISLLGVMDEVTPEYEKLKAAFAKVDEICAFIDDGKADFNEWSDEYIDMYNDLPQSIEATDLKRPEVIRNFTYDVLMCRDYENPWSDWYDSYRVSYGSYESYYHQVDFGIVELDSDADYNTVKDRWHTVRKNLQNKVGGAESDIAKYEQELTQYESNGADADGPTISREEYDNIVRENERKIEEEQNADIVKSTAQTIGVFIGDIGVGILFVINIAAIICLGKIGSEKKKNPFVRDVEREVLAGEGRAAKKAFTSELASLSKARDHKGFIAAVDKAHERYETKRNDVLARAEENRKASSFAPECDGKSTFDGTLLQRIGWTMLCNLVNAVTLGIAYPATLCWKMRWQASHTLYNGKRLSFDGKGLQLLGKWICWGLLTIITLGIYGFFVAGKIEAWKAKHTHIAGECAELGGTFDGKPFALFGYNLLCVLLSTISFGLAVPAVLCIKERWLSKHRVYDGRRLGFDGTGAGLFGNYIKWFLLSVVTLGIYSLWIPNRILKWKAEHTVLSDEVEYSI